MYRQFIEILVLGCVLIAAIRYRRQLGELPQRIRAVRVRYAANLNPDIVTDHIVDEIVRAAVRSARGRSGPPVGVSVRLGPEMLDLVDRNDLEYEAQERLYSFDPPFDGAEAFRVELALGRSNRGVQVAPQWRRDSGRTAGNSQGYNSATPGPKEPSYATAPTHAKQVTVSARDRGAESVVFQLHEGESLAMGRANFAVTPESAKVLYSLKVSRQHATLRMNSGEILIHDEGSTNGTFVGEIRVLPGEWVPVQTATIRLGNATFDVKAGEVR
jgi:FHA domain